MTDVEFIKKIKRTISDYANEHVDASDGVKITEKDVYIV